MRKQKSLQTKEVEVSGGFIADRLASELHALGVVPYSKRIVSISIEYPGGPLITDKNYKLKIITREEVETYVG